MNNKAQCFHQLPLPNPFPKTTKLLKAMRRTQKFKTNKKIIQEKHFGKFSFIVVTKNNGDIEKMFQLDGQ
jgi:hypothetical protein